VSVDIRRRTVHESSEDRVAGAGEVEMSSLTRRSAAGVLAGVLLSGGVTGCGGSSSSAPSAADNVCAARTDVRNAVSKVADDVRAGNLGDAKKALTGVETAVDNLRSAVTELGAEERDKLQPQVDKLRTDLNQLKSASSVSQAQTAAATAASDLGTLVETIGTDLGCSD
jgi:hypothetical protein